MTNRDSISPGKLDIRQIMTYLPHRYPLLLLDRVTRCEPGVRVEAIKNVTINEPFFTGHFPNYPVMPGVLILEAIAQACGVLGFVTVGQPASDDEVYLFVGIDKGRFRKPVGPGDQLVIEATLKREARGIWQFQGSASVDGEVAASADIMCALKSI